MHNLIMKRNMLAAISLVSMLVRVGCSPLQARGVEHHARRSNSADTIIYAPLTDWVRNDTTDLQWYTTISVGNPPQNLTVLIDTGSHALLIPQSNCTGCSPSQKKFDPSQSSTFSYSSGQATPQFSTGGDTVPLDPVQGATCGYGVDDVTIQGMTAPAYTFLLCYQEDEALASMPGIDGILGLGLNGSSPKPLQWALYDRGLLASSVFGLYTPPGQVNGGELALGGVDDTMYDGDLVWVSLDRDIIIGAGHSQWVADIQTIYVNGRQLLVSGGGNSSRVETLYPQSIAQVLDSGSAALYAPDNDTAAALYAQISPKIYQIDASGTWGASCEDMHEIIEAGVSITFMLGFDGSGTQFNATIPSSAFSLGPYPGRDNICQAAINNWVDGNFYNGMGLWTLGSPLLKNYYTVWDSENLQVGFAPIKSEVSTGSTTIPTSVLPTASLATKPHQSPPSRTSSNCHSV